MPILITGHSKSAQHGGDGKRKQKKSKDAQLLANSSSDNLLPTKRQERGTDTSQGYLCSMEGFNEIFNLRMYKAAPESSPSDPATDAPQPAKQKNILIGASYYAEKDSGIRKKSLRQRESMRAAAPMGIGSQEDRKLANLAMRLKLLKSKAYDGGAYEKLKARIKESTVRSWSICHGKDLADAGGNFKHSTPRDADDVVQRALVYVEEHDNNVTQELFMIESDLRIYIRHLKKSLKKKLHKVKYSESRLKQLKEHIIFADKNIKPDGKAPVDGGILQLPIKAKKRPLKVKAVNVTNYLSAVNPGAANAGAGGEKRLPLVDKLNKIQADMTAALLEVPILDKRRKNSVSFRQSRSNQSSATSLASFSPRPPGTDNSIQDISAAGVSRVSGRKMSHRKLVYKDSSPSQSRKSSFCSTASNRRLSVASDTKSDSEAGHLSDSFPESSTVCGGTERGRTQSGGEFSFSFSESTSLKQSEPVVMSVEVTESDDLVVARRGRTVSMESIAETVSDVETLSPFAPKAPHDVSSRPCFRRKFSAGERSNSRSNSVSKNHPTAPGKSPPARPKSERQRARKLALPARYENSNAADSTSAPHKLTIHDVKMANKIAESQMVLMRKQHTDRNRVINELSKKAETAVSAADESGNKFVTSWEAESEKLTKSNKYFQFDLNCKDKDWAEDIKIKYDCFATDGTDAKNGKLGVNFRVDMTNMRHRVRDKHFEIKCENLLKVKWFIILVVKLKEKIETVFTPIPLSCFKFLLAVKEVFVLGLELTTPVFFTLVDATVSNEDHKDIVVHRTLKSIRDVLKIQPDTFLEYLERKEIQPSPELLAQVRSHRKKIVNQSKLAGIAKTINSGKASMLASKPRRWGNTQAMLNSQPGADDNNIPAESSPRSPDLNDGPQTDTVTKMIETTICVEKQVTFSEDSNLDRKSPVRRLSLLEKKKIFDDIAGGAADQWKQKHILQDRRDIDSSDYRNSNIFATPDNSFEMFGDGDSSSFDYFDEDLGVGNRDE